MKQLLTTLVSTAFVAAVMTLSAHGQGTSNSSLSGTVVDASGASIPGATVMIKNSATGGEFNAGTAQNGTYSIPTLIAGTYTATVTAPGFKRAVFNEVTLVASVPATLNVTLQVGGRNETVIVRARAETLQSQTATVTTTVEMKQILQLPLQVRNVTYYLTQLPGVSSTATGGPRSSTINGMPSTALNITIDGMNAQDNIYKDSDGFYSYIWPTPDAVEEVTVSTAVPGAESAAQGAIQIKFITRSGSDEYRGALYEYHRNSVLNSNYWFNNRDKTAQLDAFPHTWCGAGNVPLDPKNCHAMRDRVLLNQFGGRVGGPISIPGLFNGRGRAFFFVNLETFLLPSSVTRTRTVYNPAIQSGIFQYVVAGQSPRQIDLMAVAKANGQTSTVDPTISKLLADIRATTAGANLIQQTDPNLQNFVFASYGLQKRYLPTVRFDFTLSSKHRLSNTWNYQSFYAFPDIINGADPAFPGFPNQGGANSNRFADSITLRSTLTPRLVNEARAGLMGGTYSLYAGVDAGNFGNTPIADQGGYNLSIRALNVTNATCCTNPERHNAPIKDVADTLNWSRGLHSLSFGGQFTQVNMWILDQTVVPSVAFGMPSGDPANGMFNTTNSPGASANDLYNAQSVYAVLTGRVTSISAAAYLNEDSLKYAYLGPKVRRVRMCEWGFFASDAWRARPNLTLNYGLRWELQRPFVATNAVHSTVSPEDMWGVSGPGNLFKPGTLAGHTPHFIQRVNGTPAYSPSWRDLAPSFGFAWRPKASGLLRQILGTGGQTVFRGGYAIAYSRPGMGTMLNPFDSNPGLSVDATRSATIGNLVTGTGSDVFPVLFRDRTGSRQANFAAPNFQAAPSYPMSGTITQSMNSFDPHMRTPYVQSWTFGVQRKVFRNTVIEARYVHSLALQNWYQYSLNEVNIKENGFLDEFRTAMANLQANLAYNGKTTFAYTGIPGTRRLPIYLAYFSGLPSSQAGDPTKYTASQFSSSNWYNALAARNPSPYTPASSGVSSGLYGNAALRQNALNAGLPPNEFVVNPDYLGGSNITGNGGAFRYDALQVELRRRLGHGLLLNANYVFAKGYAAKQYSFRQGWVDTVAGGTLKQAFKVNWVYELPADVGRRLFANHRNSATRVLGQIVGGWEFNGAGRIQTGANLNLGNVNLVGMTRKDLQDAYGLYFDDANRHIYAFPKDIRDNTYKAWNVSATSPTGYGASGAPAGRYIAPANSNGCIQIVTGDCAPQNVFITGPRFVRFDLSAVKKIRVTERANVELRAEFLNAFNNINFLANTNLTTFSATSFSEVTSAYRDPNNTQDPGGRLVQLVLRINF